MMSAQSVRPWYAAASPAWRITAIAMLAAVTALALSPTVPRELSLGWDKLNHTAAFAALAVTWRLAYPGGPWRWAQLVAGLMVVGVAIEVAQHFVPGRQADAVDLLADALGTAAGLAVAATVEWALRRHMPTPARARAG